MMLLPRSHYFIKNIIKFKKVIKLIENILLFLFIMPILIYQKFISPFLLPSCRFYPSCSTYSIQAIKVYKFKGIFYIFKRIIRCHPFCQGGIDYLPKK